MKVWRSKSNKQNMVTVPRWSDIQEGDYVELRKV